jgi:nicotinate phosphoribosyltransferase
MKNEQIYTSHLDDDVYKFHMGAFFWDKFKGTPTTYAYKMRDPNIDLLPIYSDLMEQIEMMSNVVLFKDESKWLFENTKVTQNYLVNFLSRFKFDPKQVTVKKIDTNPGLSIRINGPVEEASLWEMPLMSTISELHFRRLYGDKFDEIIDIAFDDLVRKINEFVDNHYDFTFSEFGTRRRLCKKFQQLAVQELKFRLPKFLIGTSNMYFAKQYGLKAVGTQAHEAPMFYQGIVHPEDSQRKFMRDWIDFYRGWLGIALTDTLGSKKWDKDFTKDLMIDYLGQRHDSDNPFIWGEERIAAYKRENIDAYEKTLLFSDDLTFAKAAKLARTFEDRITVTNGIGTFITNSIPSIPAHKALNQVIKIVMANGRPVAKLPNDSRKHQCEDSIYLAYMKHVAGQE